MVYEVTYYACAFCGSAFPSIDEARACQNECFKKPDTVKE